MRFAIQSLGRETGPIFESKKKAREALKTLLEEDLKDAKRRSKQAKRHVLGPDNVLVTLGKDKNSQIWSSHTITKA